MREISCIPDVHLTCEQCYWWLMCVGVGIYRVSGSDNPRVGRTEDCTMCTCNSCSWWSGDGTKSACNWRLSSQLFFRCCEHRCIDLCLLVFSCLLLSLFWSLASYQLLAGHLPYRSAVSEYVILNFLCCRCSIGHSLMYELDAFSPKSLIHLQNMVIIKFNCD